LPKEVMFSAHIRWGASLQIGGYPCLLGSSQPSAIITWHFLSRLMFCISFFFISRLTVQQASWIPLIINHPYTWLAPYTLNLILYNLCISLKCFSVIE
jgi:hypothetical protein